MTITELIEELEDLREQHGGETEVRIATQPSWPLSGLVANVTVLEDEDEDDPTFCWIATSDSVPYSESPYAPRAAWGEGY